MSHTHMALYIVVQVRVHVLLAVEGVLAADGVERARHAHRGLRGHVRLVELAQRYVRVEVQRRHFH